MDPLASHGTLIISLVNNHLLVKKVQATEADYTNYIVYGGLSEEAEGKYMARIFAEFFRRAIYRTYKYELNNDGQVGREGLFGLLRNDLSEKPSFRAVKELNYNT